ncbi:MAG: ROK family protein [Lachnospiraceae bacterium]|nr:ROK family protein [Lachnospiraceae bacterium]
MKTLGALEAGGTKMICAIGDETGKIGERISIPTTTPAETVPPMIDFFRDKGIEALGIACFGPVDPDPASKTYGRILKTPKLPWRDYDIVGAFREALHVPVGFDTDVNGSLLGEITFGASKGIRNAVYYTIGTGIGAGIMSEGNLLHGMQHAEAGHILMRPVAGDSFQGCCPSHGNCLEGMASGPAIKQRWGAGGKELADKKEVWELESDYLAQAMLATIMMLSPEVIILGGGVMAQEQLFPLIREKTLKLLNGYLDTPQLRDIDRYIVPASLHGDQGICGCLKLAADALS